MVLPKLQYMPEFAGIAFEGTGEGAGGTGGFLVDWRIQWCELGVTERPGAMETTTGAAAGHCPRREREAVHGGCSGRGQKRCNLTVMTKANTASLGRCSASS